MSAGYLESYFPVKKKLCKVEMGNKIINYYFYYYYSGDGASIRPVATPPAMNPREKIVLSLGGRQSEKLPERGKLELIKSLADSIPIHPGEPEAMCGLHSKGIVSRDLHRCFLVPFDRS
jgi:hypothetical protein